MSEFIYTIIVIDFVQNSRFAGLLRGLVWGIVI